MSDIETLRSILQEMSIKLGLSHDVLQRVEEDRDGLVQKLAETESHVSALLESSQAKDFQLASAMEEITKLSLDIENLKRQIEEAVVEEPETEVTLVATGERSSLDPVDNLFFLDETDDGLMVWTDDSRVNIHAHADLGSDPAEEYAGQFRISEANSQSGIGVTFRSQFLNGEAAYYRLRYYGSNSFHIASRPGTIDIIGVKDSKVSPAFGKVMNYRIRVINFLSTITIKAKIWIEGEQDEPSDWQINCEDLGQTLKEGVWGCWCMGSGYKQWSVPKREKVESILIPVEPDPEPEPDPIPDPSPESTITVRGVEVSFAETKPISYSLTGEVGITGPCQITHVKVPDGCLLSGIVKNPTRGMSHGLDARSPGYDPDLNLSLPLNLEPGDSLVIAIGDPDPAPHVSKTRYWLKSSVVLSCVSQSLEGCFRPAYTGNNAQIYREDEVISSGLSTISRVPEDFGTAFDEPWLDLFQGWQGRQLHPSDSMPGYGRDIAKLIGDGMLTCLMEGAPRSLLYKIIQIGIDLGGCSEGHGWGADGGHECGRKAPILFAAHFLRSDYLFGRAIQTGFQDDCQTFFVTKEDIERYPDAGWSVGQPMWGIRHCYKPEQDNDFTYLKDGAGGVRGHALVIRLLGIEDRWAWRPFFAFQDSWSGLGITALVGDLWREYSKVPELPTIEPYDPTLVLATVYTKTEIMQHGITWHFRDPSPCAQFVNGDWYVIGETVVTHTTPLSTESRNGSIYNPRSGDPEVFDSRTSKYAEMDSPRRVTFPLTIKPYNSLMTSKSHNDDDDHIGVLGYRESTLKAPIDSVAVLTCAEEVLPVTTFRPSPYGYDGYYDARDIDFTKFPSILKVGESDSFDGPRANTEDPFAVYRDYLSRPWVWHVRDWLGRANHATSNQSTYHREVYGGLGDACGLAISDLDPNLRKQLIVLIVQMGIDLEHGIQSGYGDSATHMLPVLMKNLAFTLATSAAVDGRVRTNWMTYTDESQLSWTGSPHQWTQDGLRYEHKHPSTWTAAETRQEKYRRINSEGFVAAAMIATVLGLREMWNHDDFFDYVYRWMNEDDTKFLPQLLELFSSTYVGPAGQSASSSFVKNNWKRLALLEKL